MRVRICFPCSRLSGSIYVPTFSRTQHSITIFPRNLLARSGLMSYVWRKWQGSSERPVSIKLHFILKLACSMHTGGQSNFFFFAILRVPLVTHARFGMHSCDTTTRINVTSTSFQRSPSQIYGITVRRHMNIPELFVFDRFAFLWSDYWNRPVRRYAWSNSSMDKPILIKYDSGKFMTALLSSLNFNGYFI
jgi:hypothetical protein